MRALRFCFHAINFFPLILLTRSGGGGRVYRGVWWWVQWGNRILRNYSCKKMVTIVASYESCIVCDGSHRDDSCIVWETKFEFCGMLYRGENYTLNVVVPSWHVADFKNQVQTPSEQVVADMRSVYEKNIHMRRRWRTLVRKFQLLALSSNDNRTSSFLSGSCVSSRLPCCATTGYGCGVHNSAADGCFDGRAAPTPQNVILQTTNGLMKKYQRCGGSFCLPSFCVYTTTHKYICSSLRRRASSKFYTRGAVVVAGYILQIMYTCCATATEQAFQQQRKKREWSVPLGKRRTLDASSRTKHDLSICPCLCVDLYRFYMSMSATLVSGEIYKQIHVVAINIRIRPIASGGAYLRVPSIEMFK